MSNVPHRVLLPVEILRGETIPEAIVEAFSSTPVVLLGYHTIPDQTAPDQARDQFEAQAARELEELATAFEATSGSVTTRLVFTSDPLKTFERIAVELECDGVVLLNPVQSIDRVLVPLRGNVNVSMIAELVAAVLADGDAEITLFHVAGDEDGLEEGERVLNAASETLVAAGITTDRIRNRVVDDADPLESIVDAAADHDLVVVGESRPSIRDFVFGDPSRTIADRTIDPVLVVRRPVLEDD